METRPPPETNRDPALQEQLETAFRAKGPDYRPRTRHKDGNTPHYVNRLIHEPSPYLAQHAHNPVDWWPFGDAALAEAARLDRPIFLSAGYATCHWCHVMEEESFDDIAVAGVLNKHFIAIKLDREQRPDIDQYYMLATMLQHRHGGWPNSIWARPDGRPFHTGTYFPKPQFLSNLAGIAQAWESARKTEFIEFADRLHGSIVATQSQSAPPAALDGAEDRALAHLAQSYNPDHGGFSTGTQFPHEGYVLFLLDHFQRSGNAQAFDMAMTSLNHMAAGGFHDHVGGGFHRYCVDVNWRTPHFEKMLYNQALLTRAYAQAHAMTGSTIHRRAVARCVDYVLRDMTAPDGAFYAAEDADSLDAKGQLEEGAFYVWTPRDAAAALGGDTLVEQLGLTKPPTLEAGPVLHLDPDNKDLPDGLDTALETLRRARDARARPLRDDKIILGWNALMVRALAEASQILDRPDWCKAATRAYAALEDRLDTNGAWSRIHAEGRALEATNLSDIAWLGLAAEALWRATGETGWRDRAETLARHATSAFRMDTGRYALARSGPLGPILEIEDGAVPSGESSMLELLVRLGNDADAASLRDCLSGRLGEMPVVRLEALRAITAQTGGFRDAVRRIHGARIVQRHDTVVIRLDEGHRLNEDPRGVGLSFPVGQTGRDLILPIDPDAAEIIVELTICTDSFCHAPQTAVFRRSP